MLQTEIHKKRQNDKIQRVPESRQMDYLSLSNNRQINLILYLQLIK